MGMRFGRGISGAVCTAYLAFFTGLIGTPMAHGQDAPASSKTLEWPTYGGDYANTRYQPLAKINTKTVHALAPAFIFQTGKTGSFENSPIIIDNVMYVTSGVTDTVFALDARTGERLWTHNTVLGFASFCCGSNNRGVAVADGKVFYATLDGRLISLDAKTGAEIWNIQVGDPKQGFSETMAPLASDGVIYIGSAGGEYGIRGSLTAYAAADGKQLWRWWTVGPGWEGKYVNEVHGVSLHRDIAKEKADASKYANSWIHGGGPIWMTPALERETNTIFVSVGNPAEQIVGEYRPGDNLYTDCIVALDSKTGTIKWFYQQTPHDVWDYDAVSPPVLFDAADEHGRMVPAVGEAGKTGWLYVLNRKDGHPLRVSDAFVPMANMYSQRAKDAPYIQPGPLGGSNWSPVSYNPNTHLAYVSGLVEPFSNEPGEHSEWMPGGARWSGGRTHPVVGGKGSGTFTAIDPSTGKIVWQDKVSQPLIGGSMTTTDLTFVGEGTGMFDAMDAKTGEILWQFQTGAGVSAPAVAYQIDGQEYIAIASGGGNIGGTAPGDAIIVFTLPK